MTPTSLITLLLLIVLYALAWHDKPGHQPSEAQVQAPQINSHPHKEKESA